MLVDCISGLPLYELTTPSNITDSAVAAEILAAADQTISLKECAFLADKGYDVKSTYNTAKTVYDGETFIPLNPRGTKASEAISAGNPICEAGLAMHKDGKTTDGRGGGFGRNTAAPSASPKPAFAPAATKTGTMGRKTGAAPSIRPFQQTTRLQTFH